jgi:3-deoxy-manno-octulosonate cytidylyltransferase (CMP-KDO synthetase)|tara:strand:+ start:1704 stop:2423 length:720 start_codon:yes stop_codon:yes gene_type:complete
MGKDNQVIAIIPARWASVRLPGKPLVDINGKPMIQRVYEAVLTSEVDKVVVATDNKEIEKAVNDFGGDVIMTSPKHETGTDRIIEAYENFKDDYRFVINVQGDEPTIKKDDINSIIRLLNKDPWKIATLVGTLDDYQRRDRNTVKAYIEDNEIKMFTRSPITTYSMWIKRHIGIYGFHRSMIAKIDRRKMIETTNEIVESLEQLRWVDNDIQFSYALTTGLYKGVDTEKDLQKIREYLN